MRVAQNNLSDKAGLGERDHDLRIMLGYAVFAIVLLIVIYAASTSPGTAPGEFASMSDFP